MQGSREGGRGGVGEGGGKKAGGKQYSRPGDRHGTFKKVGRGREKGREEEVGNTRK